jgi:hypothetical protein
MATAQTAEVEKAAQLAPVPETQPADKPEESVANGNGSVAPAPPPKDTPPKDAAPKEDSPDTPPKDTPPKDTPPKDTAPANGSTAVTPAATKTDATEDKKEDAKDKPAESAAAEVKPEEPAGPALPSYLAKNKALADFFEKLPAILEGTGHKEMWGVALKDSDDVPTVNVLIKFLRANEGNVKDAVDQLKKALAWRKKMDPAALAESQFSMSKFKDLGYVTTHTNDKGHPVLVTWNIYGAVKKLTATFGDVDE